MFVFFKHFIAPLLSITICSTGSSLLTTLLIVKMGQFGLPASMIGMLTTSFFLGYILGALYLETFILRVGYIRAYTTFACILTVVAGLHGLPLNPVLWLPLRFIYGACTVGIFIVIESWILQSAGKEKRGQVLAIFMLCLYGAQASGQLFFRICSLNSVTPLLLIALAIALSIFPMTTTHLRQPAFSHAAIFGIKKLFALSPSGFLGCFGGGLILGSLHGLLPISLKSLEFTNEEMALILCFIFLGGMSLQYPFGRLSDHWNRKYVLLGSYTGAIFFSGLLFWALKIDIPSYLLVVLPAAFMIGGFFFTLFPLSMNYTCDFLTESQVVPATAGLLVAYSAGAAAGPFIAPFFMNIFGPIGLFVFFSTTAVSVIIFVLQYRPTLRPL
ncbi:MAG: hypothetical protein A2Y14_04940 [Verrucomicrobia bacterium GWF2_51_19]|nr:MAG: hypothetical protein A2Y14_04940 [Verrucomicrobia bacterium GWF2_51_19]HCJ11957.1 hypothetical protein [Opitutae bacterium]